MKTVFRRRRVPSLTLHPSGEELTGPGRTGERGFPREWALLEASARQALWLFLFLWLVGEGAFRNQLREQDRRKWKAGRSNVSFDDFEGG